MNIINKLTIRQLKLNKKRTLVTILGTIISAAMITAVATLGLSFIDLMQRESIASDGEWHVLYSDVNKQQLTAIREDDDTKNAILSRDVGYAYLNGSENDNKPYLFIKEYNLAGFENFPIELSMGRLPQKSDEVVISEHISSNARVNYNIGDTLNLTVGQRFSNNPEEERGALQQNYSLQWSEDKVSEYLSEDSIKTYKIVGIIKRPTWEYHWSPGYTIISYIDENALTSAETFHVSVILKHVNNKMFEHVERFISDNGIQTVIFNNELLRYYGVVKDNSVRNMLFVLSAIIMVIIMIGSISLIYNSFAISVSERSRYLGMLSSVGATKKQKRNSVFFEGALIGAISIPIGIIAGQIGLGITFLCINPIIKGALYVTVGFRLSFYPSALIVAVLVSSVTILISTYIPARRASNISAIDAIRQTPDVKITRKQIRTSKITRRIFGIDGELGLKNLKRNKGRYKATVFSLIISMVLFLVVSSFTDSLKKSLGMTQEGVNFDIQTSISGKNDAEKENIINKITSLEDISEASRIDTIVATTWIKEALIADYLKENKSGVLEDGEYPYLVTVNVLEDTALQEYVKEIGIDYDNFASSKELPVIVVDTVNYKDLALDKYVDAKAVKTQIGEGLELSVQNWDTSETELLKPVKVAALTDIMPMGVMSLGNSAGFHIILSRETFQKMIKGMEEVVSKGISTYVYFKSNNPLKLQENLEAVQNTVGVSSLYVYNVFQYRQREEQMILLLSVFTYAFIILITAICVANIINTISTSIALRKREFAMLKSVGITPKGFRKMLNYESIFYGVKALLYGLPISFFVMYLIHRALRTSFNFSFTVPFGSIYIVIISVFIIVGVAMLYSSNKVRKENIIDALKQEII